MLQHSDEHPCLQNSAQRQWVTPSRLGERMATLRSWLEILVVLAILSIGSLAAAEPHTYTVSGTFNLIAGATGNIPGYPTDPRLLPSMTPVGQLTTGARGSLTVDLATGELIGLLVDVEDDSFTLDASYHIGGLPPPRLSPSRHVS